MAPSAIEAVPIHSDRDGLALEETSDNIDAVNVLKANMKAEAAQAKAAEEATMAEKSKFDADKDKTQFRQYEDACKYLCQWQTEFSPLHTTPPTHSVS
jgi:inositol oxygenase